MMHSVQRLLLALFAVLFLGGLQSGAALTAPTTPTADFTDNNDGTVTHNTTGLTWKRCAEGQTWSGSTCTGTATIYTWAQATALTATFAGKSDWRLPTTRELSTLTEVEAYNPAINSTIFPNTSTSQFWSASAYAGDSSFAWYVEFYAGYAFTVSKANGARVRLVRGGQSLGLLNLSRPTTDYVDNGDGTVTHTPTALTWKRCAEGQTWSGSTCSGTATGTTWAAATALTSTFAGKNDWRLPTQAELRSLVDFTLHNPAINSTIFPNTPASHFWSSPAYAGDSSRAWYVHFFYGYDDPDSKAYYNQVRLVRGGQPLDTSVSLSGLGLSCPSTINAGASGSCSATASYSDASSKSVSASWNSSNTAALSVNSGGNLAAGTPGSDTPVTISASYTENGVTKTASQNVTVKATTATLTGLSAACTSTINAGASGTCSATASYSDATSKSVSASWSSSNATVLFVNSSGSLTAGTPSTDTPVTISASYSEGGISKTATATVTVKAATSVLSSVSISGGTSVQSGQTISLTATAIYGDGKTKNITGNVAWNLVGTGATIDAAGNITAQTVTADTSVTVTATYSENGVSKTATATVIVKAAATLSSLELTCPADMTGDSAGNCSAQAIYSDGKKTSITAGAWSVTPSSAALIDASGKVTALKVAVDTIITITASYTENGKTVTATKTITIKAAACLANTGEITIDGNPLKKFGDSLEVRYRLCNFNKSTFFDLYFALQLPDKSLFFAQSAGTLFSVPVFSLQVQPYLANTLLPDLSGSVLNLDVLPMTLPTGTYTFYAVPVLAGGNVMNFVEWVGELAKVDVTLGK